MGRCSGSALFLCSTLSQIGRCPACCEAVKSRRHVRWYEIKRFVFALAFVLVSTAATAAPFGLNDDTKLLINQMTADFVQTGSSFGTASGTVNGGVTWETDITHYLPFSSGTGPVSVGSGNGSNSALAPAANWIHAGSAFTLTFSESIAAILFRITDNDTVPGKAL